MIDADTGLIIERDNGEGDERLGCNGPPRSDCFNVPARFKRVYKIDMKAADPEGFVRKIGFIDLLDIKDPEGKARTGAKDGVFTFPFVTIENVDVVDAEHIIVANDNNPALLLGPPDRQERRQRVHSPSGTGANARTIASSDAFTRPGSSCRESRRAPAGEA